MSPRQIMPPEVFAVLGGGRLAYVKPMNSDEIQAAFPDVPPLQPGLQLWALLGADGNPIMVADTRDAVMMNAWEHDLETVSVH